MNYRESLLKPISKLYIDTIVQSILVHPADFQSFFLLIFDADQKVAWRAAWACHKISEKNPSWFTEENISLLIAFTFRVHNDSTLRGCLSVLNQVNFQNSLGAELINACYEWMLSPKSSIAVQALSMKLLFKVCTYEPELLPELVATLENIDLNYYSKGFRAARNNIFKQIVRG